jgi:Fe-S-cluster-containing dehydrogenase component/formate-dependent nitrite reductase membrane component NrfD
MATLAVPADAGAHPRPAEARPPRWVKVLDQTRCIGCHACTTACKSENEVPLGVTRTYVKSVDVGSFPHVRRAFQVTRCNQCGDPPCVAICPTGAIHRRADGIVDVDKALCIGCKACMAACPYDAVFVNPLDHAAEKCNFCAHRLEVGLEPACVVVCPTRAILVGDLNDPDAAVSRLVHREPVSVRRPEKGTRPAVFYRGAHHATLDPLAARRPDAGLLAWATLGSRHATGAAAWFRRLVDDEVLPGHPGTHNSSAAAIVSYEVPHRAPWGLPVSLYTWTKGIAAGAALVAALLVAGGAAPVSSSLVRLVAPAIGLGFLVLTGLLLVGDLKRPGRFYLLVAHPQWGSWLVRGGVVLALDGAVLSAWLGVGAAPAAARFPVVLDALVALGALVGLATALYTAFLFAQARARDLWQSPLLAAQLLVQAVALGAAALVLAAAASGSSRALPELELALSAAAGAHLAMAAAEVLLGHPTAHAAAALHELVRGRYAALAWAGVALVAAGATAPLLGIAAAPLVLLGLASHEHAVVQAAQRVPLA